MDTDALHQLLQNAWQRFRQRIGGVRHETTELIEQLDEEDRSKRQAELLSRIRKT